VLENLCNSCNAMLFLLLMQENIGAFVLSSDCLSWVCSDICFTYPAVKWSFLHGAPSSSHIAAQPSSKLLYIGNCFRKVFLRWGRFVLFPFFVAAGEQIISRRPTNQKESKTWNAEPYLCNEEIRRTCYLSWKPIERNHQMFFRSANPRKQLWPRVFYKLHHNNKSSKSLARFHRTWNYYLVRLSYW